MGRSGLGVKEDAFNGGEKVVLAPGESIASKLARSRSSAIEPPRTGLFQRPFIALLRAKIP